MNKKSDNPIYPVNLDNYENESVKQIIAQNNSLNLGNFISDHPVNKYILQYSRTKQKIATRIYI